MKSEMRLEMRIADKVKSFLRRDNRGTFSCRLLEAKRRNEDKLINAAFAKFF